MDDRLHHGLCQPAQVFVARVNQNDAKRREEVVKPAGKGVTPGAPRSMGRLQFLAQVSREFRTGQGGFQLLERGFDLAIEEDGTDRWLSGRTCWIGQGERTSIGVENGGVPDFFKIVVFGSDPEDRHGRVALGFERLGQMNRREDFPHGQGRSAEKPGLLSAYDSHRFRFLEACNVGQGGGGGLPAEILCLEC